MFTALGAEPRLRIMRLLLSAHPDGLVVGEIQAELESSASTLSHHLDKLKNEDLVHVSREGTFLRYTAILKHCRNCCRSSMRNAALATKPSDPRRSFRSANRSSYENRNIKDVSRKIRAGRFARPSGAVPAAAQRPATDCCDPITSNLYDHRQTADFPKRPCWLRSAAGIRPLWPS